jgi:hypothetical protein
MTMWEPDLSAQVAEVFEALTPNSWDAFAAREHEIRLARRIKDNERSRQYKRDLKHVDPRRYRRNMLKIEQRRLYDHHVRGESRYHRIRKDPERWKHEREVCNAARRRSRAAHYAAFPPIYLVCADPKCAKSFVWRRGEGRARPKYCTPACCTRFSGRKNMARRRAAGLLKKHRQAA